jgi:ribose transport system permease protein
MQMRGVRENALKVFGLAGDEMTIEEIALTEEPSCAAIDDCRAALSALDARADELAAYAGKVDSWAAEADSAARAAASVKLSFEDRIVIVLADTFIGVMFTSVLLFLVGLILLFLAEPFRRQWAKTPTFSVGIALLVMLVFQTYALGFSQGSLGAWANFWFDNTFNVLRANTSVGMIALGMTLVIITGGIDLAVGSTLAGVGTVLMTMIDTGEHGVLVKFGITGYPAFAIGIVVALIFGVLIGSTIGLLVTKGRIPPFIVTLGVMNIIRSVAQYFTKSYTPTVPKSFEAIANTMVLGQRPMTIVYWLILAVIFYLIMKHTAFGRYVYAVGSNERTTRLSGINTDRVKLKVYMITGLVVAIAAVSQLSRLGGMDVASAGSGYELDAIAAVVVGGTAMSGGRGSIVGTVMGVLIIGIMNNLLILLGVDSFLTDAFKGAIVVVAVLMQRKEKLA